MVNVSNHPSAPQTEDVAAFEELVERYQRLVCAVAFSATGDRIASEDIAQETFLVAWADRQKLRDPAKLRSWLCGIARNRARAARRKSQRERPDDEIAERASAQPTPRDALLDAETHEQLSRALRSIPPRYRETLVLYYYEHRSIRQVATGLGLSEVAVKQRLSRGRRYLADEIRSDVEQTLERDRPGKAFTAATLALILAAPHLGDASTPAPDPAAPAAGAGVAIGGGIAASVAVAVAVLVGSDTAHVDAPAAEQTRVTHAPPRLSPPSPPSPSPPPSLLPPSGGATTSAPVRPTRPMVAQAKKSADHPKPAPSPALAPAPAPAPSPPVEQQVDASIVRTDIAPADTAPERDELDEFSRSSPGPLTASHGSLDDQASCNQCHTGGRGLSNDKCVGCHEHADLRDRIRAGKGLHASPKVSGRKCEACHLEHKGRSFDLMGWRNLVRGGHKRFDHRLSGWPLRGKHAGLDCAKCHRQNNRQGLRTYLGTSPRCIACHGFDSPHDEDDPPKTECEICHSESTWSIDKRKP